MALEIADRAVRDLTSDDVLEDAAHELRLAERAGSDAAYAAWARRWAEPTITALRSRDFSGDDR